VSTGPKRWANALLRAIGALLAVASLAPFALAAEWLLHPGGIGMEWIAVPSSAAADCCC